MKKVFSTEGWQDYLYWQSQDKKTLKRINDLIKEVERDPFKGVGKPEPLKNILSGWWSRRIDGKNRMVYRVTDDELQIAKLRDHY